MYFKLLIVNVLYLKVLTIKKCIQDYIWSKYNTDIEHMQLGFKYVRLEVYKYSFFSSFSCPRTQSSTINNISERHKTKRWVTSKNISDSPSLSCSFFLSLSPLFSFSLFFFSLSLPRTIRYLITHTRLHINKYTWPLIPIILTIRFVHYKRSFQYK